MKNGGRVLLPERKNEESTEQEVEINQEEMETIVVPIYQDKEKEKVGFLQRRKLKKEEKKKRKQSQLENKRVNLLRQTTSLLPFLQIHDDYIMMKDGYMEIYQIETKDLYTRNDEDLNYLMLSLTKFYRSYYDDMKIIAMNFPSNTERQRKYWQKKLESADDPVRIGFINRKLFELDFLEKERTNREFFLFLYADNEQQLSERKKQVVRSMQQAFPLATLTKEKKQDVLFILNNQNTKI